MELNLTDLQSIRNIELNKWDLFLTEQGEELVSIGTSRGREEVRCAFSFM